MSILGYNLGTVWIGDMSGCGYNLCFAEEARRVFSRQKENFPKCWAHCSTKLVFRDTLDFWVIKQFKIAAEAQPGGNFLKDYLWLMKERPKLDGKHDEKPYNRPPKGDRSEGFIYKYRCLSIFLDLGGNFIKNHILKYGH